MLHETILSRGTTGTALTPIAIFLSHLLSLGHTGQEVAEIVRLAEEAFRIDQKNPSISTQRREKERLRKAAYRDRLSRDVPRDSPPVLSSLKDNTLNLIVKKKERNKDDVPHVPRDMFEPDDGWPSDFLEQFWREFPPYRRQAKEKVREKLARIRKDAKVSWAALIKGVRIFAATNPGQFAPAPMVWLNDGRWDCEYGGSNGTNRNNGGQKLGYAGIAEQARRAASARANGQATFSDAADHEPANGHRASDPSVVVMEGSWETPQASHRFER